MLPAKAEKFKQLFRRFGVEIRRTGIFRLARETISGRSYGTIVPNATLSPWLDDRQFMQVYESVRSYTLVDIFRCFELWELVEQVTHLPGDVLEVGVWRGGTGCLIAARTQLRDVNKVVYLCDTFAGVVKASDQDSTYLGGEHSDAVEADVIALINTLQLQNTSVRRGIFPDDFAQEFEENIFCFVHIDVDVYQSAKDVMHFIWPRLASSGGVVVFDDFGFPTCDGIPKLISEYRGDNDKLILHNLNGHAIIVKTV